VKMEKSFEIVESVKLFSGLPLHPFSEVSKGDEEMFGRMVTNSYRAAFENLVRAQYMEAAFEELIKEGVIEKEKVDSFNLPLFCPNVEEFESIVKTETSFEIVESVKLFSGLPLHPISEVTKGDEEMFGRTVANGYRAAFENLVRAQLGSDGLTNEFYLRIEKMAAAKCQEYLRNRCDQLVAFLVRK